MSLLRHCPRDGVPGEPIRMYRSCGMLMQCPSCAGKWFAHQADLDGCTSLVFAPETCTPRLCAEPCVFVETFFDRHGRDRFGVCATHLRDRVRFWNEVGTRGLAHHTYSVEKRP